MLRNAGGSFLCFLPLDHVSIRAEHFVWIRKNTAINEHTVISNLNQGVSSSICWHFMMAFGHVAHSEPRLQRDPAQQPGAK